MSEPVCVELIAAYLGPGFLVDVMSLDDWNNGRQFSRVLRDKLSYHERRLWSVPKSVADEIQSRVPQFEPTQQAWLAAKRANMYLPEINPQ